MIVLDPVAGAGGVDVPSLRRTYGCFPTGVTAVCALHDGAPVGMAVSSFSSVSMDPPLVSVSVQLTSKTWPVLAGRPRLGLSVMASAHGPACRQLASKDEDRFAGLDWSATEHGALFLRGAAAWLDCSIHDAFGAGDHRIVLLRVEGHSLHEGVAPLVFHASRFHRITQFDERRDTP